MPPPEPEGVGLGELALACAQQTSGWAIQQLGAESRLGSHDPIRQLLVGRIPLAADAGTSCVVAVQAPLAPGRVELPRPSDDELRHMRDWAVNGVLVMTIIGEMSDGAIALIDLRPDSSVGTSINSALS